MADLDSVMPNQIEKDVDSVGENQQRVSSSVATETPCISTKADEILEGVFGM